MCLYEIEMFNSFSLRLKIYLFRVSKERKVNLNEYFGYLPNIF
jgi:hypothetical protein